MNEFDIERHLDGDMTCGLYLLNSENYCYLICIDIDIPKSELNIIDFTDPKQKYTFLKEQLITVNKELCSQFKVPPDSILFEETGGRGYHIWIFFDRPIKGQIAVKFGAALKAHLGFEVEFFPKQGCLTPSRKYGNLIKLPLGIHQKYNARSSFFTLASDELHVITDVHENLAYLQSIKPKRLLLIFLRGKQISKNLSGQSSEKTNNVQYTMVTLWFLLNNAKRCPISGPKQRTQFPYPIPRLFISQILCCLSQVVRISCTTLCDFRLSGTITRSERRRKLTELYHCIPQTV